jgi:hypothetical protein
MRKSDRVWVLGMALFWLSFAITFLVDYLNIVGVRDLGLAENLWISWILWTMGLGSALAILTSSIVEE